MLFNGKQAQDPTKFSQIVRLLSLLDRDSASVAGFTICMLTAIRFMRSKSSGLGSASCSHVQTGTGNNFIKITCVTSTLTQYVCTFFLVLCSDNLSDGFVV